MRVRPRAAYRIELHASNENECDALLDDGCLSIVLYTEAARAAAVTCVDLERTAIEERLNNPG